MFGFQCSVRQTNESKGGRYVTYTVTVTLRDRLMLTQVTHAISKIEGVRLVL
jgi:putative lipoic acid-binding regulatory protein